MADSSVSAECVVEGNLLAGRGQCGHRGKLEWRVRGGYREYDPVPFEAAGVRETGFRLMYSLCVDYFAVDA